MPLPLPLAVLVPTHHLAHPAQHLPPNVRASGCCHVAVKAQGARASDATPDATHSIPGRDQNSVQLSWDESTQQDAG
eukprot:m.78016 g.78016  ORF g.78016 m.78016 type:complete len:77 (-) comp19161_c0_seq2:1164-1394(-)